MTLFKSSAQELAETKDKLAQCEIKVRQIESHQNAISEKILKDIAQLPGKSTNQGQSLLSRIHAGIEHARKRKDEEDDDDDDDDSLRKNGGTRRRGGEHWTRRMYNGMFQSKAERIQQLKNEIAVKEELYRQCYQHLHGYTGGSWTKTLYRMIVRDPTKPMDEETRLKLKLAGITKALRQCETR